MSETTTILVVDDEPHMVELICEILESQGFRMLVAHNATEALDHLDNAIDLVLLDIMMPGMDGIELCGIIKGDPRMSGVPVMMVTGKHDVESQLDAIYSEADGYIFKPFDVDALIEKVRSQLDSLVNPLVSGDMDKRKPPHWDGQARWDGQS